MQAELARGLLGLSVTYTEEEFRRARRRALLRAHPDHGGSREELARVEAAVSFLSTERTRQHDQPRESKRRDYTNSRDCPSFTIDALPVEAFEWLLLAAVELGDVVDDEPPYRLEVAMNPPSGQWVVLEVVPDAGSSTVSIMMDCRTDDAGHEPAWSVTEVRDAWVTALNGLQTLS